MSDNDHRNKLKNLAERVYTGKSEPVIVSSNNDMSYGVYIVMAFVIGAIFSFLLCSALLYLGEWSETHSNVTNAVVTIITAFIGGVFGVIGVMVNNGKKD